MPAPLGPITPTLRPLEMSRFRPSRIVTVVDDPRPKLSRPPTWVETGRARSASRPAPCGRRRLAGISSVTSRNLMAKSLSMGQSHSVRDRRSRLYTVNIIPIPMALSARTTAHDVNESRLADQRRAHDLDEVCEGIVVREIGAVVQPVHIPEHRRSEEQKPHDRSEKMRKVPVPRSDESQQRHRPQGGYNQSRQARNGLEHHWLRRSASDDHDPR